MNNQLRLFSWFLFAFAAFLTLVHGEVPLQLLLKDLKENFYQIFHPYNLPWNPLLHERLPRLIVLICTGASLAVSGAVLQSLFHNPLASPSVLGITSGGSLVVMLVFISGLQQTSPYVLPIAAVSGCLLTLLMVFFLSKRNGMAAIRDLILTGIAISTALIAIQSAIMYALKDNWQLFSALKELEIGTSNDRSWLHVHLQLPLTVVGLFGCWYYKEEMNLLALGDEEAKNLGVDVEKVRWRLFLSVSLLTGGALAAMGVIAFFGLVLPHLIRLLQGPDNRSLIPLCALLGSSVMISLDIILRFLNIYAFTIGNVSAVLGGIFFLILLLKPRLYIKTC